MLRWALISILSAVAFLSIELIALKTVCGGDKKDKASDRAQQAVERANRVRNDAGGGSSQGIQPRRVEPRSPQRQNFDSSKFKQNDVTPRVQPQPKVRVDAFRPSINDPKQIRTDRLKDAQRSDPPKDFNKDTADAIRKARDKVSTRRVEIPNKSQDNPAINPSKFDKPNFTSPSGDKHRDTLDRTKLKRDLKLGGSDKPTDRKLDSDGNKLKLNGHVDSIRNKDADNKFGDKNGRNRHGTLPNHIGSDRRPPTIDADTAAKLAKQNWVERVDRKHIDQLVKAPKIEKLRLNEQFRIHDRGDVARRLDLHDHLVKHGGWQHRNVGIVSPIYRTHCSYRTYCGPSWYPRRCWYPVWGNWVSWSWTFGCDPWFDPRPLVCRPVIYDPCPVWVAWQYPVWRPLPVVACGTWVDVPSVVVDNGCDVQLLAVRFVDPGHLEQQLGPRYRVWIRNNSPTDIDQPFNVMLLGTNEAIPGARRLEMGQRVPNLGAGQTLAINLRLPLTPSGQPGDPFAFSSVHALVDAHRELNDIDLANNGAVIDLGDIMPVDPATFRADNDVLEPGTVINIAGEGLGPEPGQVMLCVDGQTYQPEILGWYDLGVQVRVPEIPAGGLVNGDLVIVRGDGAAANPLEVQIANAAEAEAGRAF